MCFNLLLHDRKVHYVAFISFFIGLIVCSTVLSLINITSHMLNTQTKVYQNNIYDNSLHSTQMGTVTFSYVRHGSFCGILQTSLFPMYVLSTELHGQLFVNTPSNDYSKLHNVNLPQNQYQEK